MKHNIKITLIVLALFLLAQSIGLVIVNKYLTKELPFNIERPELSEEFSYIQLFVTILIITAFAVFLTRIKSIIIWKIWFFISVLFALLFAFAAFIPQTLALLIALVLTFYKVLRPNIIIHNFTELFIYGGLAGIFVPIFTIKTVFFLLILISVYDMIAVWKTKHMIKLAKFQSKLKIFAGLLVPYSLQRLKLKTKKAVKTKIAILGGGDIGFTLIFAGVVMKSTGFTLEAFITPLIVTLALALLLFKGKKNKFYPAMPFLSIGCLVGYLITLLI